MAIANAMLTDQFHSPAIRSSVLVHVSLIVDFSFAYLFPRGEDAFSGRDVFWGEAERKFAVGGIPNTRYLFIDVLRD